MDPIIYVILYLSIMIGSATILNKVKVHPYFVITFFFHGSIYLGASVWEASVWAPGPPDCHGDISFSWGLWILVYGLIGLSFVALYAINQSNYMNFDFSGINWKNIGLLSTLVVGNILFFGVLEDLGCYIIWGVEETFGPNKYAGEIHQSWVGLIPTFYLSAVPGIILIVISLYYSRKIKE